MLEGFQVERWVEWMNADLNMSKEKLNLFLVGIPSNNLNMARMNLNNEKPRK